MILPELIAHRGYARHYPENTLVGLRAAIDAGARFIEIDVQLSTDQVPVLFHDRSLDRICGVEGEIYEQSFSQIQRLHASEPKRFGYKFAQTPIATLAEFSELLQKNPDVTAFVEIKPISVSKFGNVAVIQAIMPHIRPLSRQCILISYSSTSVW